MQPVSSNINIANLDEDLRKKIVNHRIFQSFTPQEINSILPYFKLNFLRANSILEQEGETSTKELFVIVEGNLTLLRESKEKTSVFVDSESGPFLVAKISTGDIIGEFSFLQNVPRSATIRVVTPSIVLGLEPSIFVELKRYKPELTTLLMQNLLLYVSERLKSTTDSQVLGLTRQLETSERTAKSNIFFSYIIGLLCLYNLAINLISQWSTTPLLTSLVSAGIILVFFLGCLLIIKHSHLPLSLFGITWKGWKGSLRESLFWTAIVMVVMLLFKWALITFIPSMHDNPLIQFQPFEEKYHSFNFILYGLHSPIQEFIARGVLQGSLQHFFVGKNVTTKAIIVSNGLFAATHVHLFGGFLAILVFGTGLFWGWLYSRQQNLIGVSISHILIGWWGLFILSFDTLFI